MTNFSNYVELFSTLPTPKVLHGRLVTSSFSIELYFIYYKVLGTFIMEWDEGKFLANKLLSSKDSAKMYAERLSELAAALGFDGWLVSD